MRIDWIEQALPYAFERTRYNMAGLKDFPERTEDGQWQCVENGGWVGGHWTGLLWLAYAHTQAPEFRAAALEWTRRLAPRQNDTTTHDLGFLFELSHVLGSQVCGDASLKGPALQAARTLSQRFNSKGRYFQAWGALDAPAERRGRAIVDTMMNLDLLFWASRETGDARFAEMAVAHAHTALAYQVRPDGSTSHAIDFDPETGEFLGQGTHQGLSASSCWSRGQAWAVYGFAECYRETHAEPFLEAARRLARYSLRRSPADRIPYWDYDSPLIPNDVRDSSAAAIFASGLLLLACLETDMSMAAECKREAGMILESLWNNYSSRGTPEPSILIHATRSKPHGLMDHGLIYGDYYFLEGLTRLKTPTLIPAL